MELLTAQITTLIDSYTSKLQLELKQTQILLEHRSKELSNERRKRADLEKRFKSWYAKIKVWSEKNTRSTPPLLADADDVVESSEAPIHQVPKVPPSKKRKTPSIKVKSDFGSSTRSIVASVAKSVSARGIANVSSVSRETVKYSTTNSSSLIKEGSHSVSVQRGKRSNGNNQTKSRASGNDMMESLEEPYKTPKASMKQEYHGQSQPLLPISESDPPPVLCHEIENAVKIKTSCQVKILPPPPIKKEDDESSTRIIQTEDMPPPKPSSPTAKKKRKTMFKTNERERIRPLNPSSKPPHKHPHPPKNSYKYQEVIRNKAIRRTLPGHTCEHCNAFVNAICTGSNPVFDRDEILKECSRHKCQYSPENTPDGFWELSFADSIAMRKRNYDF